MDSAPSSSPLTFKEYQSRAVLTDRTRDPDGNLVLPLLGLFGETGSLLSEAKKKHRDAAFHLGYEQSVVEELGDVLWYLTVLADRARLQLCDIAHAALPDNTPRDPLLSFKSFGQIASGGAKAERTSSYDKTLLRLAGQVGILLSRHEAGDYDNKGIALSNDLTHILRLLIDAAGEAQVTLEQAALQNLAKIFDRWPQIRILPHLFDEEYPKEEQIPRQLDIEIFERSVGSHLYVFQRCNGINIGDRLTDNNIAPDDYRFHDAFHYAYAAVLGWSPVLRALFRVKRKSNPAVDEGQDGARAGLIEEGIATLVFDYAKRLDFFATVKSGGLPLDILKMVRRFASGYEPEVCPLWLWEDAILQGYSAFRYLKVHRRGRLCLDLERRSLIVEEMA